MTFDFISVYMLTFMDISPQMLHSGPSSFYFHLLFSNEAETLDHVYQDNLKCMKCCSFTKHFGYM